MPVDPSISLGVGANVPKPQPLDPMSLIGNLTAVQNQMNTNTQFKLTNAARQRAGQIIAGALDEDDAIAQLQGDKLVMGYYPDALKNIRDLQTQMANLTKIGADTASVNQGMVTTGLHAFGQTLPSVLSAAERGDWKAVDSLLNSNGKAALATTTSPTARRGIQEGMNSIKTALMDGLPDDPAERLAEFRMRMAGSLTGVGMTPDILSTITGTTNNMVQGGVIQPGVDKSPLMGGGFRPVGPAIPKATEPGYVDPGLVPVPAGGPGAPQLPGINLNTPRAAAGANAPANTMLDPTQVANPPYANRRQTVAGTPALSPAEQKAEDALHERFNTDELTNYQANTQAIARLHEMDTALNQLQDSEFLKPGTGAQIRLTVGTALNTFAKLMGSDKMPVDESATRAGALLGKDQIRTAFDLSRTQGAREALQVVNAAMAAVPGIENTYLGGKMIIDSLQTAAQYEMDRRQFKQEWDSNYGGVLKGADEAFVAQHPIQDRIDAVAFHYGFDPDGTILPLPEFKQAIASDPGLWRRQYPNLASLQSDINKGNIDRQHAEIIQRVLDAGTAIDPLNTKPLGTQPELVGPVQPAQAKVAR